VSAVANADVQGTLRVAQCRCNAVLLGLVLAGSVVALGCLVIYAMISGARMQRSVKADRQHLRQPSVEALAPRLAPEVARDVAQFYREATFVEQQEFVLIDERETRPTAWRVGEFYPITERVVRRFSALWRTQAGVPIADDMSKGTYFVEPDGTVILRVTWKNEPIGVTDSVRRLAAMTVTEDVPARAVWPGEADG